VYEFPVTLNTSGAENEGLTSTQITSAFPVHSKVVLIAMFESLSEGFTRDGGATLTDLLSVAESHPEYRIIEVIIIKKPKRFFMTFP
jgi:hypothetical protein